MPLSDFIAPESLVARSVNIERDMGDKNTLSQYFLTEKGTEIIQRLVAGLNGSKISAWSLTGPYGMGKSSFVNYMLSLVGPKSRIETKLAREMLYNKDPGLYDKFQGALSARRIMTRGFFRVAATASFQSVNHSLAYGLYQALNQCGKNQIDSDQNYALRSEIESLINKDLIDTKLMVDLYKRAILYFGAPAVIVIDEFGKNLEYMARNPSRGDLYSLQALAETEDIYLWVCLHQSFEEYAVGFSSSQLQEWGKIQGRFEDISFVEPKKQMIEFIRKALQRNKKSSLLEKNIKKWARNYNDAANQINISGAESFNQDYLESIYPLHPLAALLLPELCVRYAQNDRTLFAFLCGGEPSALPGFLSNTDINSESSDLPTLGVDHLYNYFISSIQTVSSNRPGSSRWLEINQLVEETKRLPENEHKIIKYIGLLNLVSGHNGYKASEDLISFAQPDHSISIGEMSSTVKSILDNLVEKGILIYREYADEYRLWEGTDFDITAAMREQRERLFHKPLVSLLRKTAPLIPLAASRHSFITGTLRHFHREWSDISEITDIQNSKYATAAKNGLILYCFGKDELNEDLFKKLTKDHPLIIAYARSEEQIKESIIDTAAAHALLTEYPELDRDGVARKEVRHRAKTTEDRLRSFLSDSYTPGNPEVSWYAQGEEKNLVTYRGLSVLMSRLCDRFYRECPIIRNELINRDKLTGVAASARRKLMAAMLSSEEEENIGFEGTGPEVAIYRSMFKHTGLHSINNDDTWSFVPPNSEHGISFQGVSKYFDNKLALNNEENLSVSDIFNELAEPPYGIKMGPIPVLVCYYLALKSDELALYQHGSYIPVLGSEEMEMMTKRPEFFSIRRFTPTGVRKKIFQFYRRIINAQSVSATVKLRNVSMVSVVGPMTQFANNLTSFTRQTRTISKYAQNVRNILLRSKEPIELLFVDLPIAVGLEPFHENATPNKENERLFESRLQKAFKELMDADKKLITDIINTILQAFGSDNSPTDFRIKMIIEAEPLIPPCRDSELKSVLSSMVKEKPNMEEWYSTIASAVMTRPIRAWRDSDLLEFPVVIRNIADRFKSFNTIVKAQAGISNREGKITRLVTNTKPGGIRSEVLIEKNIKDMERAKFALKDLKAKYNKKDIESILLLLSDELFGSND